MGDKKAAPKPVYLLNLEREISKKLFDGPKGKTSRTERDPITQSGISLKETEFPSDAKPRGLARGAYSTKGNGSFKFDSEARVVTTANAGKRAECIPVNRNPITQDHPSLAPQNYSKNREQYSKVRDSTVFSQNETNCVKTRDNQYYQTMKSNVFNNDRSNEVEVKKQLKFVGTQKDQMPFVLNYLDGSRPEPVTCKPTSQRINYSAVSQVKELSSHAKTYNERRNQSAICFNFHN
jgi:hypothetical protein